jgi:hypothetical protein
MRRRLAFEAGAVVVVLGPANFLCSIANSLSGHARELVAITCQTTSGSLPWPAFAELDRLDRSTKAARNSAGLRG